MIWKLVDNWQQSVTGRPLPRCQTKERHKLQLTEAKISPCKTHNVNGIGEGEATYVGEANQCQRNYKLRKETEEQTPRITR